MKIENPTGKKTIILQKNEKKQIYLEDFSEKESDFELEIRLDGDEAAITIIGRAQTMNNVSKKWIVRVVFCGKNQKAFLDLKGTAEDKSFLEFDGSAILEKMSEEGDVGISEKIVLFDQAKGRCLPVLTVKIDKVKSASHAASVAPFDQSQVLFCQARGITKKDTEDLLKEGFLLK